MGCLANSTAIFLFLKSRKVDDDCDDDYDNGDDDLYIIRAVGVCVSAKVIISVFISVKQKYNKIPWKIHYVQGISSFLLFSDTFCNQKCQETDKPQNPLKIS